MRTKWIVPTFGVLLLVVSLAGNVWLLASQHNYTSHSSYVDSKWLPQPHSAPPETPVFPMTGLSSAELNHMLEQIENAEKEGDNRLVLRVQVVGKSIVEIKTGKAEGPLSGIGRIFIFNKTQTGWTLDKERIGGWVS